MLQEYNDIVIIMLQDVTGECGTFCEASLSKMESTRCGELRGARESCECLQLLLILFPCHHLSPQLTV